MKRVLFWKIYLGFGATFVVVVEALWLLFNVLHPVPSDTTKALAKISLGSARVLIEHGGEKQFQAMLGEWPMDERGKLFLEPWTDASRTVDDIDSGVTSIRVQDPAGKAFLVSYRVTRHLGYGRGPFDIRPEIVLLAMAGGLIFSGILAWHLTYPIHRISNGFAQLANANFSARLGPSMKNRNDELASLAREFDRVAERLEELVASRDKLISDVSHELRTPLTRLQLAIGLAKQDRENVDESLARIGREISFLDDLVAELLTLSKLESGPKINSEYFDLAEILKSVVGDARFEASASREVNIIFGMKPPQDSQEWVVAGSWRLVHRAIENVVRNAIRFSHRGQEVEIELDGTSPYEFIVRVMDSGPGVAAEFLPDFFEPFAKRSATEDPGVGLGLSIAKRAIIACSGEISARNRKGGGLDISIRLPAVTSHSSTEPAEPCERVEPAEKVLA
ncbi:MAG TPA: ATP-binding protein [Terracidiphilus sp.]